MTPNCTERQHSTVATQALELMNSERSWSHAKFMAGRIIDNAGADRSRQIEEVYWRALSRQPTPTELADALRTLDELTREWPSRLQQEQSEAPKRFTAAWLALANICHAILNSAAFSYID